MADLAVRAHTQALLDLLAGLGVSTGFNQAPASTAPPYHVLYPLPSSEHDGTLRNPDEDRALIYQLTTVGRVPEEAEHLADLARALLTGATLTVAGRAIWRIEPDELGRLERDDALQPPLHYAIETYRLWSVPA